MTNDLAKDTILLIASPGKDIPERSQKDTSGDRSVTSEPLQLHTETSHHRITLDNYFYIYAFLIMLMVNLAYPYGDKNQGTSQRPRLRRSSFGCIGLRLRVSVSPRQLLQLSACYLNDNGGRRTQSTDSLG
jgi:hypothetical protein